MTITTAPTPSSIKARDPYEKPKGKKYYENRKIITSNAYLVKINLKNKFFNSMEI